MDAFQVKFAKPSVPRLRGDLMAARFQYGGIDRKPRKSGPDVWALRFREYSFDGSIVQRSKILGTVEQHRTKGAAKKAALAYVSVINEQKPREGVTLGAVIERF